MSDTLTYQGPKTRIWIRETKAISTITFSWLMAQVGLLDDLRKDMIPRWLVYYMVHLWCLPDEMSYNKGQKPHAPHSAPWLNSWGKQLPGQPLISAHSVVKDAIPIAWPESPTIRHIFLMGPSVGGSPPCCLNFPLRTKPETMEHRHAAMEKQQECTLVTGGVPLEPSLLAFSKRSICCYK